jgi:hypothetical protein
MEPISIALYAVLTIVMIIYVISPLFGSGHAGKISNSKSEKATVEAESEADIKQRIKVIGDALKDLEFEYSTGKLSEEEYRESAAQYREMDTRLNARLSSAAGRPEVEADSDDTADLEEAVRARRKQRAAAKENTAVEENNIPLKSRA